MDQLFERFLNSYSQGYSLVRGEEGSVYKVQYTVHNLFHLYNNLVNQVLLVSPFLYKSS